MAKQRAGERTRWEQQGTTPGGPGFDSGFRTPMDALPDQRSDFDGVYTLPESVPGVTMAESLDGAPEGWSGGRGKK